MKKFIMCVKRLFWFLQFYKNWFEFIWMCFAKVMNFQNFRKGEESSKKMERASPGRARPNQPSRGPTPSPRTQPSQPASFFLPLMLGPHCQHRQVVSFPKSRTHPWQLSAGESSSSIRAIKAVINAFENLYKSPSSSSLFCSR